MQSMKRMHRARQHMFAVAMVVLAGFSLSTLARPVGAQSSTVPPANPTLPETPASEEVLWAYQNAFRNAAQMALPVVVKIDVAEIVTQTRRTITNPFSFFFGRDREDQIEEETREFTRNGLGSGVIVRRIGAKVYVLTNDHVVGEADQITLTLHDGRQFDGVLLGTDSRRDLAVVVFETDQDIPVATLGDSNEVEIGDWAFAIGNPLGFESTVTSGIISAVGRRASGMGRLSGLTDYIQTDAAINQGNSGGALVNLAGEVVGINTWIASQSGGNVGLGFAIPINNARETMNELISLGRVQDGWLGIRAGSALDGLMVESLELPIDEGVLVASTYKGSPAATAGLLPGDVIVRIEDVPISRFEDLVAVVGNISPGEFATFRLYRNGRMVTRQIQLGLRDEDAVRSLEPWPGFMVMPLTDDIRTSLGLRNESGQIVIGDIEPLSAAAEAGLRRGDVIRSVNDEPVESLNDFYEALNGQADTEFVFRVSRMGRELLIGLVR
jgi:serine protease Do